MSTPSPSLPRPDEGTPEPPDSDPGEFVLRDDPATPIPGGKTLTCGLTTPAPDQPGHPAVWPVRVGRYLLEGEVARGGMGVILRGRDAVLGREVALKVLHPRHRGETRMRRRFLTEARIAAGLQHPGVVPVYDQGELSGGLPFFTMRLVEGRTLAATLEARSDPTVGLQHLLLVFQQVCQTMAYAHSRRVIHLDLKPANVMVARFGAVQVMDWGVAKELGETATDDLPLEADGTAARSGVFGTPAYMPPEQAVGAADRLNERSDVFSLGAILFEILTGYPPYPGTDAVDALHRAAQGDLTETFALLGRCRAETELVPLLRRCLASDPADRPRDAEELARTIASYLESNLQRAERDLVRFFELSLDLFCLAGLDGFFRRVNANFTKVLGYSEHELVSRPFIDFVHPDDRDDTALAVGRLSRGEPVTRFRNRYQDAGGGYRWLEWTAKAVPEEGVIFAVAREVGAGDPNRGG